MIKTVAIIPARKGSVGLPGKNHKLVNGRPLIEYTINEAIKSKRIDDIIVSTDCPEIIRICKKYEKNLKILIRPPELAQSNSKSEEVVTHACDFYLSMFDSIDNIIILQPTSPIRSSIQIDESIELFESSGKMSLVSVTEPIQHPYDFVVERDGNIKYICREENIFLRQEFTKSWFINGAIYITEYKYFKNHGKIYDFNDCTLYKMPIESSIDIDTQFDLEMCDFIIRKMEGGNHG